MDDARVRGHGSKVVQRLLAPAKKLVPLSIPLKFQIDVDLQGVGGAEPVDLDRVIDDEIHRDQRIDFLGISAHAGHRAPHCRQVHNGRNTREVLQHDA